MPIIRVPVLCQLTAARPDSPLVVFISRCFDLSPLPVRAVSFRILTFWILFLILPGCVVIETGVRNPVPEMSKVAVLPFINSTFEQDEVVDGYAFAMAYYAELQKVPGFEVVPVDFAERTRVDNNLRLDDRRDMLTLAKLLNVDAIVVGEVTDYEAYYPPRIGLSVDWLSQQPWMFYPGIPTDPEARERWLSREEDEEKCQQSPHCPRGTKPTYNVRGQSPDAQSTRPNRRMELPAQMSVERKQPPVARLPSFPLPLKSSVPIRPTVNSSPVQILAQLSDDPQMPDDWRPPGTNPPADTPARIEPVPEKLPLPMLDPSQLEFPSRPGDTAPALQLDPTQPVMSYTRFFDGRDADLLANLRDYLELSDDLRAGGWKAYLERPDDFRRFVAHRMIVEMLTLHGGEGRRRFVLKSRKYK